MFPGVEPEFRLVLGESDGPGYPALRVNAYQRRLDGLESRYDEGPWQVAETIERYPSGVAAQLMADARRVVQACPEFDYRTGAFAIGLSIVSSDFAGAGSAESLLIERATTGAKSQSVLVALVRVGDLVATLYVPPHLWTPELAREAVRGLCNIAPQC